MDEYDRLLEQERIKAAELKALHFTSHDWNELMVRMEADKELTKQVMGGQISMDSPDWPKMMKEVIDARIRAVAEEQQRLKKLKPLSKTDQRTYMQNFIAHVDAGWSITQAKKLKIADLKEEFQKQVDRHMKIVQWKPEHIQDLKRKIPHVKITEQVSKK